MESAELILPPSQRTQPEHTHELCESCAGLLAEMDALYEAIDTIGAEAAHAVHTAELRVSDALAEVSRIKETNSGG